MKYAGLEPNIKLRDHMPSVVDKMEMLIPALNHTHRALIGNGRAKDLTGAQIVDSATPEQRDWLRNQGLIA